MQGGIIQKTITAVVLLILAAIAGSLIAESSKEAVLFVAAIAGIFFVIALGRRCWWLIFLTPPLLNQLPLGIVERMPVGFAAATGIMLYWVILSLTGFARLRWRSAFWMDCVMCLVLILFIYSYICHPVVMGGFAGNNAEFVGGQEYIWCIFAILYYVALSSLPCSREELDKVLRWSFFLILAATILSTLRSAAGSSAGELAEKAQDARFGLLAGIGNAGALIIVCRYRILEILFSPLKLAGLGVCCMMILLCGFRESFVSLVCVILFIALIRRELISVSLLAVGSYAILLYASYLGVVKELPFGIQRCLSIVPGVEVTKAVEKDAGHSSEWRVVMWRWALDPRTGYIKDYTWGDGFAINMRHEKRYMRASYRGQAQSSAQGQEFFARTGTWHNGPITAVHRLGYVGLGLLSLWMLCGLSIVARGCAAFSGQRSQFFYLYLLAPMAGGVATFYLSAGTITKVFALTTYVALGKVVYCLAREEGLLKPLFSRKEYIPLVQRPEGRQS